MNSMMYRFPKEWDVFSTPEFMRIREERIINGRKVAAEINVTHQAFDPVLVRFELNRAFNLSINRTIAKSNQ